MSGNPHLWGDAGQVVAGAAVVSQGPAEVVVAQGVAGSSWAPEALPTLRQVSYGPILLGEGRKNEQRES